jgi:hypothetical protein
MRSEVEEMKEVKEVKEMIRSQFGVWTRRGG